MLLDLVETYSQSYQGKLHVDLKIKTKLSKGQKLDPEEHKINYRTRVVQNQQKRLMDHIFGDKNFMLKDLSKLCDWMATDKAEWDFFNSHLVAGIKGKEASLSYSTIATLAHSMIELLKYVSFCYSDQEVQESVNKALGSMWGIEQNAAKHAQVLTQRRSYLDKSYYLVPIEDINKMIESRAHTTIIQAALWVADTQEDKHEELIWKR